MKLKIFKKTSSLDAVINSKNSSINDIEVFAKMIHTGKVLSVDEVNKNRSSKYNYLAF